MFLLKSVTSQVENSWASRRSLLAPSFPKAKRRSMNLNSSTNDGVPNVLGTITSRQWYLSIWFSGWAGGRVLFKEIQNGSIKKWTWNSKCRTKKLILAFEVFLPAYKSIWTSALKYLASRFYSCFSHIWFTVPVSLVSVSGSRSFLSPPNSKESGIIRKRNELQMEITIS